MSVNFVERLLRLINEKASGNQAFFANKTGISAGAITAYTKGRLPQAEQLIRIHEAFDVNLNWLLTGTGKPYVHEREYGFPEKCLDKEEYLLVPLLQSWVKGGPEGRIIYEGIADYYPFKRYFVEKLVGSRPERAQDLYLARVRGDSMAPTINDGETILFDIHEGERLRIKTGDIYLVQLPDGSVTVKRLAVNNDPEGTRLICNSDNVAAYRTFEFRLDPDRKIQSYVLGRVRWAGKEFD